MAALAVIKYSKQLTALVKLAGSKLKREMHIDQWPEKERTAFYRFTVFSSGPMNIDSWNKVRRDYAFYLDSDIENDCTSSKVFVRCGAQYASSKRICLLRTL